MPAVAASLDTAPMDLLHEALRAGHAASPRPAVAARRVLVAGGAGVLGAAVLEQLLGSGRFAPVEVLVTQPLNAALRPLVPVFYGAASPDGARSEDTALVIFDRERHVNGREQAFYRPQPEDLRTLAQWLLRRGVRRLVVVMPHTQASLPEALKRGLATLDEQAVAALGFEQLVFVRSAQAPAGARSAHVLQRVADALLSQLHLMVAERDRPVRALKVAQFVAALAVQLAQAPHGTRVVPPELVWQAAQSRDVAALARAWLHGEALEVPPAPRPRL